MNNNNNSMMNGSNGGGSSKAKGFFKSLAWSKDKGFLILIVLALITNYFGDVKQGGRKAIMSRAASEISSTNAIEKAGVKDLRKEFEEKERELNLIAEAQLQEREEKLLQREAATTTSSGNIVEEMSTTTSGSGNKEKDRLRGSQKSAITTTTSTSTSSSNKGSSISGGGVDDNDHVAACVMVMDANHELIEWLAYHYYTLPLRRLIILNDPNSKTTPEPILQRWHGKMEISIWNDTIVFPNGLQEGITENADNKVKDKSFMYTHRQAVFNAKCIRHLWDEGNHRWVTLFDPDEYMTINERVYKPNDPMYQLGLPTTTKDDIMDEDEKERQRPRLIGGGPGIPTMREQNATLTFIKRVIEHVQEYGTHQNPFLIPFESPCIGYKRIQYQPYENEDNEKNKADTSYAPLDNVPLQDLLTYRFRHWHTNGYIGKSLLDLHGITKKDIMDFSTSVHWPVSNTTICRVSMAYGKESVMPLVMNHYASSLDQLLFRSGDSRGSIQYLLKRHDKEKQQQKSRHRKYEPNAKILGWLPGFIEFVGKEEAQRLLQYAGRPYKASMGAYIDPSQEVSEEEGMKLQQQLIAEAKASKAPPKAHEEAEDATSGSNIVEEMSTSAIATATATSTTRSSSNKGSGVDDHFAICLMIMDGNHELIEWIAYHYHTLPLRRLIVLNDPHSKTTPEPILQRWQGRIDISIWNDTTIFPDGPEATLMGNRAAKLQDKLFMHVHRQGIFQAKCMRHLYDEGNHRWVVLPDPDEYMTINERVYNETDPMYHLGIKVEEGKQPPIAFPTMREPNATSTFINQAIAYVQEFGANKNPFLIPFETPCLAYKRKLYQPYEDLDNEKADTSYALLDNVPLRDLSTYRWRYWVVSGRIGKGLLDYHDDRIKKEHIGGKVSMHRPIKDEAICPKSQVWEKEELMPLIMNHYSASLDQALFRSGDGRGAVGYRLKRHKDEMTAHLKEGRQHEPNGKILGWLPGFIESVGKKEAERLLQYVGRPYKASIGAYYDPNQEVSEEEGLKLQQQLIAEAKASDPSLEVSEEEGRRPQEQPVGGAKATDTSPKAQDKAEAAVRGSIVDERSTSAMATTSSASRSSSNNKGSGVGDHFAICLMIMDGNHELIEWIAYHYHTLPLRRLIVLNDPHSKTTPEPILQRWQGRIDISIWNDTIVFPNGPGAGLRGNVTAKLQDKLFMHVHRQGVFQSKCMRHLYDEGNHRWVVLPDPDEYMTINERVYNEEDPMYHLGIKAEEGKQPPISFPTMREPNATSTFINQAIAYVQEFGANKNPFLIPFETPCLAYKRKLYQPYENEHYEKADTYAPLDSVPLRDLSTYRWRYWVYSGKIGKGLLDYHDDRIKKEQIAIPKISMHRPIKDEAICRKSQVWEKEEFMPLIMNHYSASLDQALFRSGDGRGAVGYRLKRHKDEMTAHLKYGRQHEPNGKILGWLPGFIESVGKEEAERLLQYVGRPYKASIGAYYDPNHEVSEEEGLKLQQQLIAEAKASDPSLEVIEEEGRQLQQQLIAVAKATDTSPKAQDKAEAAVGGSIVDERSTSATATTTASTSTSSSSNKGRGVDDHVAACVMVMDANHDLIEWLAYHYHTLPLRRLIVLNDPHSRTTPEPILKRWQGRMEISIWNDTTVFPNGLEEGIKNNVTAKLEDKAFMYVYRQGVFNAKCMRHLYDEGNHRWVTLFDPDEYMTINERVYKQEDPMHQLGHKPIAVPTMREPNATLTFIKRAISHVQEFGTQQNPFLAPFESPCLGYRRKQYQPYDNEGNEEPVGFAPLDNVPLKDLSTYRWRYWVVSGQIGKALLDFDRIKKEDITGFKVSMHRPIQNKEICRVSMAWAKEPVMPLVMNHYASSLDQSLFRSGDSRGSVGYRLKRHEKEKEDPGQRFPRRYEPNGRILGWLPGFIESVGKEEAERLLQYAGRPYKASMGAYFDPSQELSEEEGMKLQQQLIAEAEGNEAMPS